MKQVCTSDWKWLIGKQFSLGTVIDTIGNTATVERGDDTFRILVCELLEEHDKNNVPIEGFIGERFMDIGTPEDRAEAHRRLLNCV